MRKFERDHRHAGKAHLNVLMAAQRDEMKNLPGHVRRSLDVVEKLATTSDEVRLLTEMAKSYKTRILFGRLTQGHIIAQVLSILRKETDFGTKIRIARAIKRAELEEETGVYIREGEGRPNIVITSAQRAAA